MLKWCHSCVQNEFVAVAQMCSKWSNASNQNWGNIYVRFAIGHLFICLLWPEWSNCEYIERTNNVILFICTKHQQYLPNLQYTRNGIALEPIVSFRFDFTNLDQIAPFEYIFTMVDVSFYDNINQSMTLVWLPFSLFCCCCCFCWIYPFWWPFLSQYISFV